MKIRISREKIEEVLGGHICGYESGPYHQTSPFPDFIELEATPVKEECAQTNCKEYLYNTINNPSHYTANGSAIECADYIESHTMDFFQGNIIKYVTRFKLKRKPKEDLLKAKWYLERLISKYEKESK